MRDRLLTEIEQRLHNVFHMRPESFGSFNDLVDPLDFLSFDRSLEPGEMRQLSGHFASKY